MSMKVFDKVTFANIVARCAQVQFFMCIEATLLFFLGVRLLNGETTILLPYTKPKTKNFSKFKRTCSSTPENNSEDTDSKPNHLKEQATKIERVIEDNKHKIEHKRSDITDEECEYDFMSAIGYFSRHPSYFLFSIL